ncbi:MAG: hypothetical protein Q4F50_12015 [Bacteroides sp.]|nr:hypothetical protein [Bacteroides sp.]MDO5420774.1 hypothetical protein [Bacteroides sp.]
MERLKYKGYSGSVENSEEDNCLFGKAFGLKKIVLPMKVEPLVN